MKTSASTHWRDLVKAALADSERLKDIYVALAPAMSLEACNGSQRFSADVLQAGRLAIWKKLSKVDITRPDRTIGGFLRKMTINAMRDETRRLLRQERKQETGLERERDRDQPFNCLPNGQIDERFRSRYIANDIRQFRDTIQELGLNNYLKMYASYVRKNGRFLGAHKTIAARLGISIPLATRLFHANAQAWIEKNGLKPAKKKHAGIIEKVLKGHIKM